MKKDKKSKEIMHTVQWISYAMGLDRPLSACNYYPLDKLSEAIAFACQEKSQVITQLVIGLNKIRTHVID